jgi:hypothetical protein
MLYAFGDIRYRKVIATRIKLPLVGLKYDKSAFAILGVDADDGRPCGHGHMMTRDRVNMARPPLERVDA